MSFAIYSAIERRISINLVVPLDEFPPMSCTKITTFWNSPGQPRDT